MAKPKLGTGARFKALKGKLAKKGATSPGALAAWIGRKKYGKSRFQSMAKKGKVRGSGPFSAKEMEQGYKVVG